jgi:hypothetical protein
LATGQNWPYPFMASRVRTPWRPGQVQFLGFRAAGGWSHPDCHTDGSRRIS